MRTMKAMLCKTMLPSNESRHTVTPKPKEKGTRSRTLILQCYIITLHLLPPSFLTGHITKDGTSSVTSVSSVITLPAFLNQSGRNLHPVKGDGNCMFRCFSHHLLGNEEEHDAVRTLIIRFENFNRQYFEPLLMNNNEPTLKGHE